MPKAFSLYKQRENAFGEDKSNSELFEKRSISARFSWRDFRFRFRLNEIILSRFRRR